MVWVLGGLRPIGGRRIEGGGVEGGGEGGGSGWVEVVGGKWFRGALEESREIWRARLRIEAEDSSWVGNGESGT